MTKKMIERYVILDMLGNVVENAEDIKSSESKLRVYDREKSTIIISVHSLDVNLNLDVAKACIIACDEYVPPAPEHELEPEVVDGDENSSY